MYAPMKRALIAIIVVGSTVTAQAARQASADSADAWTRADIAAMEAETMARVRAVQGDQALPPMPPLGESPRLDDLGDADRQYTPSREAQAYLTGDGGATLVEKILGTEFTGTSFFEFMQYQLPTSYDDLAPEGHPLVIAYHGYAGSHQSTSLQSTIHLECENRGWIYMAPIGLDSHFFGPPVTMQHLRAAIDWTIDNFNVDEERIYMVGFSMGAGVSANFAARHRDPNDLMLAGLGLVGGTYDWTQEHSLTTSAVHFYMEHPLCFAGPPSSELFKYQQASTQYFDPGTYTPSTLPGTRLDHLSMGINLGHVPTFVTWDTGDTLPQVPAGNTALVNLLTAQGTDFVTDIVTGTPTPHSWSVLDEVALFDFFEGRTAIRTPQDLTVLTDEPTNASYLSVTPRNTGAFTRIDAESFDLTGEIVIETVTNVDEAIVDVQTAGISGIAPVRLTATSNDLDGFTLRTTNYDSIPSYKLDHSTQELVKGTRSDPTTDSVFIDIDGLTTLDADVISEPWTAKLSTTPNPVPIGDAMQLDLDTDLATDFVFLNIGFEELLVPIKDGNKMVASPLPPAILLSLPVDANGDLTFPAAIPNDMAFQGLSLFLQAVAIVPGGGIGQVSNMWVMDIE